MTTAESFAALLATAILFFSAGFACGALWAWRGGGG